MKTTLNFNLAELKLIVPEISATQCDYFVEACIIALEKQGHHKQAELTIIGDFNSQIILRWKKALLQKAGVSHEKLQKMVALL